MSTWKSDPLNMEVARRYVRSTRKATAERIARHCNITLAEARELLGEKNKP